MPPWIVDYQLDLALFTLIVMASAWSVHRWLRRGGHAGLSRLAWVGVIAIIILSAEVADVAGNIQRDRLRDRLQGFAPTYAQEVSLLGHATLSFDTAADDPTYRKIIDAQVRWEHVNPDVNDIYTFRRNAEGKVAFLVDSETDYDHDGKIDAEREQCTPIGEVYPEATPAMAQALAGVANFDPEPVTDRWGTWVSAYVPLYDAAGRVEGALGVDYDASLWCVDIECNRLGAFGFSGLLLAIVLAAIAVLTVTRSELAKRTRLQQQLIDASRQAGMAEVATGVLHNVGNALNSVNVSATMLAEKLRDSKVAGFGKAAGMIREHRDHFGDFVTSDAKGRVLPDYLLKLADLLAGEQQTLLGEVATLERGLGHIKHIVVSQQTLAKSLEAIETIDLAEMVDDALRMGAPDANELGVQIQRHTGVDQIESERHSVLQILVNLISNAVRAMNGRNEKCLTIAMASVSENGVPCVRIDVADTGVGMTEQVLAKLFKHGFTTRSDGHGFGLHHSAIAAHNLHGRLTAASDGPGCGATFTLILPISASKKGVACQAT